MSRIIKQNISAQLPPLYCFLYQARDQRGEMVAGEIQSINDHMAKKELQRRGMQCLKIKRKTSHFFTFKPRIHSKDIILITRQWATLTRSGVALLQAMEMVANIQVKTSLRILLQTIKQHIENGALLSDALAKHPQYFDPLYCSLMAVGEQSGTLDHLLDRVATYKEKMQQLKTKVKKALFYPMAVLMVSLLVMAILLLEVVPQFKQLFSNVGASLPWFTQWVLDISHAVQTHGLWFLLSVIAIIVGVHFFYRCSPKQPYVLDKLSLHVYLLGDILQKAAIARFSRTLSILLTAGVPLVEGLSSVANVVGNRVYHQAIVSVEHKVASGQSLQEAMRATTLFPIMVVQLIAVGEEAGSLDHMLTKMADMYEQEVSDKIDALSQLLEPMLMVILGVMVGGLIIAIYLPIFQMGNVLG